MSHPETSHSASLSKLGAVALLCLKAQPRILAYAVLATEVVVCVYICACIYIYIIHMNGA